MAELEPAVKVALERVQQGRREHEQRQRRYDHAYEVYRASADVKGIEPWRSRLRVKYGMQVIDTALVNIVSGQPRVIVRPRQPEAEISAKAMQLALDYYVGEDHLVEKQPTFVQQGLITGVTVAKNHWIYRTAQRPIRNFSVNAIDPALPPTPQVQMAEIVVRDGPTFEPWDVNFAFWAPGARDADSAEYIVLQSYVGKDELLANACSVDHKADPHAGCTGIYHNVDQLIASGQGQQPKSTAQARALGRGDERFKDKFLLEEIWTDDTLVVIGNGQVMLRAQPNPYWHGRKPVVIAQTRPDLFEMVGIPETELVDDIQQALWTLQNMTFDNLHLTVMRGITYREGGVTDPNSLVLKPRFKWAVSDHDDIKPFAVEPVSTDVFTERGRLLADMQLVTGINPYVSGSDLQTVDQNTATGVTALQEVASRLLRFKASQIHYKGYQRTFEMWGDMIQQFLDRDISVKIVGPGGEGTWLNVGPQDVAGHFSYVLEGSEESLSRQQERGEAIALLNAFAPLVPTGQVNIKPLLERVATAYDFPNPEALLAAPQPQLPPAAPAQQFSPQHAQQQQTLLGGQPVDPRILNAIGQGR